MKAIICPEWGNPVDVLQVKEVPIPPVGPGQVRVRMLASPINPSDIFMIRGQYGYQPPLPCVPGFEGVGIVEEGKGILAWRVIGKRVAVLNGKGGNWAEQVVIPARNAVPIPDNLSVEEAASFFVNPASALAMIRHVLKVPYGAWLLQTAAGSSLGKMIVRLSKIDQFRTINVVRRKEQINELKKLGAQEVIVSEGENIAAEVKKITGGSGVPFAIDAVGGIIAEQCLASLSYKGKLVLYSNLSGKRASFDPRVVITGDLKIEGFWLTNWVKDRSAISMLGLFRTIGQMYRQGITACEAGSTFSLDQFQQAVIESERRGKLGKVLFKISS